MTLNISLSKIGRILLVLTVVGIFLLCVRNGFVTGKHRAQSERVLAIHAQLVTALGYFKQDQGRFPTEREFADRGSFGPYLSVFPIPHVVDGVCGTMITYKVVTTNAYSLDYCLPIAMGSAKVGVNKYSGK